MPAEKDHDPSNGGGANRASASVESLLIAALERGGNSFQTGRYLVTFKEGVEEEGLKFLKKAQGMRIADARDFDGQAVTLESIGDADAIVLPEIGVALVSGDAALAHNLDVQPVVATGNGIASIDPEYFAFADGGSSQYVQGIALAEPTENISARHMPGFAQPAQEVSHEYLHGFLRAADIIAKDLLHSNGHQKMKIEEEALALGATWGLIACKVPSSVYSGLGIRIAVLGAGFDLGHPDFTGRPVTSQTFVGEPIQDLTGQSTHCTGTACGPKAPGSILRYGIGSRTSIFVGKVLTNSGTGTMAGILAGINWAVANRCPAILANFGSGLPVQPAYTAAGQAALNNGCLIIAPAGGSAAVVGAPANSPTIMSVAAVNQNLQPSSFSSFGKVDIAAPGVDIFSAWSRPRLYNTISGTSSSAAHVAGCAALWAEASASLRGITLWRKLLATAKPLSFPPVRVGAGLVQAP